MKLRDSFGFLVMITLASCGPARRADQAPTNSASPALPAPRAPAVVNNAMPPAPARKPTVDPKSSEAAVDLVRSFVELLNRGEFNEAYMLLGPAAEPRSDFDRQFSRYSKLKVTTGPAGDQEGAAGSIYISVPMTVSGTAAGQHVTRSATAILRRVNDVPGSTEAQRHWHIERIDWKSP